MPKLPLLQRFLIGLSKDTSPRLHVRMIKLLGILCPNLRSYRAMCAAGESFYLDLSETMCLLYFLHGELPHEKGVREIIRRSLRPKSVFIDVGANIGWYTRQASRLVGDQGRVLALEPLERAFRLLELNTKDCRNVTLLMAAATSFSGNAHFFRHKAGDMSSLEPIPSIHPVSVDVVTLDSLLSDVSTVDLIKIDVEGHELQVLRGAADLISRHQPLVIFEFLQSSVNTNSHDFQQFEQYFRQFVGAKYEIRGIEQTPDGCVSLGPYKPGVYNYAAIPELRKESLLSSDFPLEAAPSDLPQHFPNA